MTWFGWEALIVNGIIDLESDKLRSSNKPAAVHYRGSAEAVNTAEKHTKSGWLVTRNYYSKRNTSLIFPHK